MIVGDRTRIPTEVNSSEYRLNKKSKETEGMLLRIVGIKKMTAED